MKVSLSWLRQYVDVGMPLDDLETALTMAGLEVDSVVDRYGYLDSVRVGRVDDVIPHPHADRLKVCRVEKGGATVPVVCGAPNVQPNIKVPLALPGTVFPDGSILEKSTIRGVTSEGMICSAAELGLGVDAAGILVLDRGLEPGTRLAEALDLSDSILEIDLTPNRPDCLSIIGVAREIGAIHRKPLRLPDFRMADSGDRISDFTSVTIENPDLCPRYAARLVTDIAIGPSPFWLQDRLMSVGLRPINNIVDITNFILMETGQPLHAFDFDRLAQNRIVVRTAAPNEHFVTLDGKDRQLSDDTLMICDGEQPVAIAGVMGGLNSEIKDDTRRVLIESAFFNPAGIRKTAKRLGLHTDASHRFERGVDPEGTIAALNRAARLMADICGGKIVDGLIDAYPKKVAEKAVVLSVSGTNRLLGTEFTREQIQETLETIAFDVTGTDAERLSVKPPSFRVDIDRPEDLVEEIARISGYHRIPTTFPRMPAGTRRTSKRLARRETVRQMMTGLGYAETINYSFVHRTFCEDLRLGPEDSGRRVIPVLNPLSEDQAVMRTSLIPGLLQTMGRNLSQQIKNLKLFEIGKIYKADGQDTPAEETEMLAGLWTGSRSGTAWYAKETPCDFYDIKGTIEGLLEGLGVGICRFEALDAAACPYLRPGHAAEIRRGEERPGRMGEVHPLVLKNFDLKQAAFVFELDMERLLHSIPEEKHAEPIPKFPSTARDATLIVDRDIEAGRLLQHVASQDEPLVEQVRLFDVYEGSPIPEGRKSISFRITYRSAEKTLEDEVVNALHKKITERLIREFNAGLPA